MELHFYISIKNLVLNSVFGESKHTMDDDISYLFQWLVFGEYYNNYYYFLWKNN